MELPEFLRRDSDKTCGQVQQQPTAGRDTLTPDSSTNDREPRALLGVVILLIMISIGLGLIASVWVFFPMLPGGSTLTSLICSVGVAIALLGVFLVGAFCVERWRGDGEVFSCQGSEGSWWFHSLAAVLWIGASLLSGGAIDRHVEARFFAEGDDFYAQGRYDDAIEEYTRIRRSRPNDRIKRLACRKRANARTKAGLFAEDDLTQLIKLSPDDWETLAERGRFYLEQRRYGDAVADLERALQLAKKDRYAHMRVVTEDIETPLRQANRYVVGQEIRQMMAPENEE